MTIEREVLEQAPAGVTDEQLARVVERFIDRREKDNQQKTVITRIQEYVEGQKRKEREQADPSSGKSLVTKEMLNEIINSQKRLKDTGKLPTMTKESRESQSESEKKQRREKFSEGVEAMGGSVVDALEMIVRHPGDNEAMRQRVIDSMSDAELEKALLKCVGDECKPLRTNFLKRGYRIERKDQETNRWGPLAVQEEQNKDKEQRIDHF